MAFDFTTRLSVPSGIEDTLRTRVLSLCAQGTPCDTALPRSPDCACYAEYAAQYWLTSGGFPAFAIGFNTALQLDFEDPGQAQAVSTFLATPERALKAAWSSLVFGPPGSGKSSLATQLAKVCMKWELVHAYKSTTRAVYFKSRDYIAWLRRLDDFKRTAAEVDYLEGALLGSVLVWDDVDVAFASDARFAADLKKRLESCLPVHIVLSQSPENYVGSLLFNTLGVSMVGDRVDHIRATGFMAVSLQGAVLSSPGWI